MTAGLAGLAIIVTGTTGTTGVATASAAAKSAICAKGTTIAYVGPVTGPTATSASTYLARRRSRWLGSSASEV